MNAGFGCRWPRVMAAESEVSLRAWTADDLPLLRGLLGDRAMMTYVGVPESE